jgi:hypothetical protein
MLPFARPHRPLEWMLMRHSLNCLALILFLAVSPCHAQAPRPSPGSVPSPRAIALVNHRVLTVDDQNPLQPGDPKIEGRTYSPIPASERATWALLAEKARELSLDKSPEVVRELANSEDQRLALVLLTDMDTKGLHEVDEGELTAFLLSHNSAPHFPEEASIERQRAWGRVGVLASRARKQGLDRRPDVMRSLSLRADRALATVLLKTEEANFELKARVSEDEVWAYFEAHANAFQTAATITYRKLSVFVGQKAFGTNLTRTETEAQCRIAEAQAALKTGAPFPEVVSRYSDDSLRTEGGLHKELALASVSSSAPILPSLRDQPVGIVGSPFRDTRPDAICMILVEARTPARTKTFEEAQTEARNRAIAEKKDNVVHAFIDSLKKEIPFELLETK